MDDAYDIDAMDDGHIEDFKAMDSDEEEVASDNDGEADRDDDIDIGFRSHNFQYGAHGRNRKRSRTENQEDAIYGVFNDSGKRNRGNDGFANSAPPVFVKAKRTPQPEEPPMFVAASKKDNGDDKTAPMFVAASKKDDNGGSSSAAPMFVTAKQNTDVRDSSVRKVSNLPAWMTNNNETSSDRKQPPSDGGTTSKASTEKQEPAPTAQEEEEKEEERLENEQKEADAHFMALIEQAKQQNQKSRRRFATDDTTNDATATTATSAAADTNTTTPNDGDIHRMPSGMGLPSSFGGVGGGLGFTKTSLPPPPPPVAKKDPTVGTWEKHTKGFGSSMLAKMGWKGSGGLGSNRRKFRGETGLGGTSDKPNDQATSSTTANDSAAAAKLPPPPPSTQNVKKGISKPVEVVVRPANMGLGFGNFKEASQLKSNRRLEAEVRGIDYDAQLAKEKADKRKKLREERKQKYGNLYDSGGDDSSGDDDDLKNAYKNVQSSAIPSNDEILATKAWRRNRAAASKKKRNPKNNPEIIPYQELIERQRKKGGLSSDKPVIIDMRGPDQKGDMKGPDQKKEGDPKDEPQEPKLGEELLYNINLMLGKYENRLYSQTHHYENTIKPRVEAIDHKLKESEEKEKQLAERIKKFEAAAEITDKAQEIVADTSIPFHEMKKQIYGFILQLERTFSPQDQKDLQFWQTIAPSILDPVLQEALNQWNPFVGGSSKLQQEDDQDVLRFYGTMGDNATDKASKATTNKKEEESNEDLEKLLVFDDDDVFVTAEEEEARKALERRQKRKQRLEQLQKQESKNNNNANSQNHTSNGKESLRPAQAKEKSSAAVSLPKKENSAPPKKENSAPPKKENPVRERNRYVIDLFFEWARKHGKNGRILCEDAVRDTLVPKLKADIESETSGVWDPVTDPYSVMDVYDYLSMNAKRFDAQGNAPMKAASRLKEEANELNDNPNQVFAPSNDYDSDNEDSPPPSKLEQFVRKELILEGVYPKLQSAVTYWKPTLSSKTKQLENPLHLWILPWVVHLDHPVLLPNLMGACKRKLKAALKVLQRGIPTSKRSGLEADRSYLTAVLNLLRPWHAVYDSKSMQKIIADDSVFLPRFERLLLASIGDAKTDTDYSCLLLLFEFHALRILSDVDFMSLLEGPFLTQWARFMHSQIYDAMDHRKPDSNALDSIVLEYQNCKIRVFVDPFGAKSDKKRPFDCSQSIEVILKDAKVCRIFFSVLKMIEYCDKACSKPKMVDALLDEMDKIEPEVPGFYVLRGKRAAEERENSEFELEETMASRSKAESKARATLQRRNIIEPTFREVVEAFAGDKGVVFMLKYGAQKDGKQIYRFGKQSIYLENDVVFYRDQTGSWRPISLDQLGTLA